MFETHLCVRFALTLRSLGSGSGQNETCLQHLQASSILKCFQIIPTPHVAYMLQKRLHNQHTFIGHVVNGKLRFDCACASKSRVEPSNEPIEKRKNYTCEPARSGECFLLKKHKTHDWKPVVF